MAVPDNEDVVNIHGKLLDQQPAYDKLINSEIQFQRGDTVTTGRVARRAVGPDGRTYGTYHPNPTMNTVVYEGEFPDGDIKEYLANMIAENMLRNVDEEGFTISMLEGITDWRKDETALSRDERYVITRSGQRKLRKTTKGVWLKCKWTGGMESWVQLKTLKERCWSWQPLP